MPLHDETGGNRLDGQAGEHAESRPDEAREEIAGFEEKVSAPSGGDPASSPALADLVLGLREQVSELRVRVDALAGAAAGTEVGGEALAQLSAELDAQRDKLCDYEKSLVERIADVDDDRRTTASLLQRAWQTHREQMEARLRRGFRILGWALALTVLAGVAALFWVHRQVGIERNPLAGDIHRPQAGTFDSLVEDKLTQLSSALEKISSSLTERGKDQDQRLDAALGEERAARSDADARLVRRLQRLEEQQQVLARQFEQGGSGPSQARGQSAPRKTEAAAVQSSAAEENKGRPKGSASAVVPANDQTNPGLGDSPPSASGPLVLTDRAYGIQLIGFNDFDDLKRFAARPSLPQPVYYLREIAKGHPLYLVMHSLHKDRSEARAAAGALPADLAQLGPLIRTLPAGTKLWLCRQGTCERAEE
jgi:DamX protein